MRLAVVGTGYVGLVSGTCFAEFGHDVICVDNDQSKIDLLHNNVMPIYEPGLDDLVAKQVEAKRLSFTTNLADAVKGADAIFIAVGTPPRPEDGHADLQYVYAAAKEAVQLADGYTVLVTKSTVPVGTAREIEKIIAEHKKPNSTIDVCSNPEFLREGAAIDDFLKPDRVVIGADTERAEDVMRVIYQPLEAMNTPFVATTPESSEITKYASNAFLATKVTFINEIANLCEVSNGIVEDVAYAMGLDTRIGSKFLNAGPGYGGSCFPKDTLALTQTGEALKARQYLVEAVVKSNNARQKQMSAKVITACGGSVEGLKIGVLGVAFKPNTDDVRDAPALEIIPALQAAGAIIHAHDPEAQEEASKILKGINWEEKATDVANDADAVVILTEWDEYKNLDMKALGNAMTVKRLVDLRNVFKPDAMRDAGFHYVSIGRASTPINDAALKKAS